MIRHFPLKKGIAIDTWMALPTETTIL